MYVKTKTSVLWPGRKHTMQGERSNCSNWLAQEVGKLMTFSSLECDPMWEKKWCLTILFSSEKFSKDRMRSPEAWISYFPSIQRNTNEIKLKVHKSTQSEHFKMLLSTSSWPIDSWWSQFILSFIIKVPLIALEIPRQ